MSTFFSTLPSTSLSRSHHHSHSHTRPHSEQPHRHHHHHHKHSHKHKPRPNSAVSSPNPRSKSTTSHATSRPRGYPRPLGRGNGFPTLSRRFISLTPITLTIHAQSPRPGRSYTVRDPQGPLLNLSPSDGTNSNKTLVSLRPGHLRDDALLQLRPTRFSARSAITLTKPKGKVLLLMHKASLINVTARVIHAFIHGAKSSKPHLVIEGTQSGSKYDVRDKKRNPVCTISRCRPSNQQKDPNHVVYRVVLNPGYDIALFASVTACVHEIWTR